LVPMQISSRRDFKEKSYVGLPADTFF